MRAPVTGSALRGSVAVKDQATSGEVDQRCHPAPARTGGVSVTATATPTEVCRPTAAPAWALSVAGVVLATSRRHLMDMGLEPHFGASARLRGHCLCLHRCRSRPTSRHPSAQGRDRNRRTMDRAGLGRNRRRNSHHSREQRRPPSRSQALPTPADPPLAGHTLGRVVSSSLLLEVRCR